MRHIASFQLSRRGIFAASLLGITPAVAQGNDFKARLSRLRVGANLERWFPIARDNNARRLGRSWWRDFRAVGFDPEVYRRHFCSVAPERGYGGRNDDLSLGWLRGVSRGMRRWSAGVTHFGVEFCRHRRDEGRQPDRA